MLESFEAVLDDYHLRYEIERRRMKELGADTWSHADEFLLPIGPSTGQTLATLIEGARARTVIDIGTSFGYSALWFARAARKVGGRVISLDIHAGKQAYATEQLRRAGLDDVVEMRCGDARETLRQLKGPFDFVLIDVLWKDLYTECFDLLRGKLSPGALVAADNMTWPDREAGERYRAHVGRTPGFTSLLLPIGSGVELSMFNGDIALAGAAALAA